MGLPASTFRVYGSEANLHIQKTVQLASLDSAGLAMPKVEDALTKIIYYLIETLTDKGRITVNACSSTRGSFAIG